MDKFQRILHGFRRLKLKINEMLHDIHTPNSFIAVTYVVNVSFVVNVLPSEKI